MAFVNRTRYISFTIADLNGDPVSGRQPSLAVTFTRNDEPCTDPLVVTESGGGKYCATYTPSSEGTDRIEIYDADNDVHVIDVEPIQYSFEDAMENSSEIVTLDETYAPNLKPMPVNPGDVLYVFASADWQAGQRTTPYAMGTSLLNPDGSWQTKIDVMVGAYHVVVINGPRTTVIAPFLQVTKPVGTTPLPEDNGGTDTEPPPTGGGGGTAATIAIGTVVTGAPGSQASVTNSGSSSNAVFNFSIPRGDKGTKGDAGYTPQKGIDYFDGQPGAPGYTPRKGIDYFDGEDGKDGIDGRTPVKGVDYFDGLPGYTPQKGVDYFDGADGVDGKDGAAGTIAVGTVTTGAAGSAVIVENRGTPNAAILDITIPKGDKGDPGTAGGSSSRSDVTLNTAVLADAATENGTLALGKSFDIMKVVASAPCRIRLYSSVAKRDADAARDRFTEPELGAPHGVIAEWVLSDVPLPDAYGYPVPPYGLSFIASPEPPGADVDQVNGNIAYAVTNLSGSARSLQITITRMVKEQ